jgi:GNAT superfamily N-acetyltransferase
MYVTPSRRSEGLGRQLLDTALTFCKEVGVDGVALWPTVRAVPFYERFGFGGDGAPLWLEVDGD